jgi:hypothetical protein
MRACAPASASFSRSCVRGGAILITPAAFSSCRARACCGSTLSAGHESLQVSTGLAELSSTAFMIECPGIHQADSLITRMLGFAQGPSL